MQETKWKKKKSQAYPIRVFIHDTFIDDNTLLSFLNKPSKITPGDSSLGTIRWDIQEFSKSSPPR